MHVMREDQTQPTIEAVQQVIIVDGSGTDANPLVRSLQEYGLASACCRPDRLISTITRDSYHAVILGPHLTALQVWELCREVRQCSEVVVIVLGGHGGSEFLSMALDAGADAAFGVDQNVPARLILSAMHAVHRRERFANRVMHSVVEVGPLRIDLFRKSIELNGAPVALTATEFGILAVLVQQPGRVISAAEIVRHVHGYEAVESEAQDIVKVHISRLRQKLESEPRKGSGIANVRGQGYMYLFERRRESHALDQLAAASSASRPEQ